MCRATCRIPCHSNGQSLLCAPLQRSTLCTVSCRCCCSRRGVLRSVLLAARVRMPCVCSHTITRAVQESACRAQACQWWCDAVARRLWMLPHVASPLAVNCSDRRRSDRRPPATSVLPEQSLQQLQCRRRPHGERPCADQECHLRDKAVHASFEGLPAWRGRPVRSRPAVGRGYTWRAAADTLSSQCLKGTGALPPGLVQSCRGAFATLERSAGI